MARTKFSRWLDEQRELADPVGDFAREVHAEPDTYGLDSLEMWVAYLRSVKVNAPDAALRACGAAWARFYAEWGRSWDEFQ